MLPLFTTLMLLALLGGLVYVFLVWNFGYWRKRGVKEAKSYPFVGSFPSLFTQKRNVIYDIDDIYRQYKHDENFVGVHSGRRPQLIVLTPEYAHKVYVNDFRSFHDNEFAIYKDEKNDQIFSNNIFMLTGEAWKKRRAEVTPGLTGTRVGSVYPVTLKGCATFVDYIRAQSKKAAGKPLDTKELCLRYTTEVVSDCVLGIKANSMSDEPTPIYGMIKRVFDQSWQFILFTAVMNILPQIRHVYMARLFAKEVETFFFDLMSTSIELRRKMKNSDRIDFLNYMLYLQEKHGLSTRELTSHTMTFLTDGFETTATVLAHTLLLLGRNPTTQEKLLAELGTSTEALGFEALSELPYLEACIHEAIRIFSPLLMGRKICSEPYEFINKNGSTVQMRVGDVVIVPVHSIHHDPDNFEAPEEFRPERFMPENGGVRKYREMGAYLGFGDGPRVCPGQRFAMTQMKAALAEIVRTFEIKVNSRTRSDNYLDETYFMAYLNGGIWLEFVERH